MRPSGTGAPAGEAGWIENRPTTARFPRPDVRELIGHRELALFLALRDLQLRYKQTFLGVAWAILKPLAGVVIFTFVFGRLAGLPSDGLPYAVFVYAGFTVWTYFSGALDTAAQSLVGNEALVSKIYFPRLLAPLAAVLPNLVDLGLSLVILAVFMAIYGVAPGLALLTLPLWLGLMVVFTFGAGALFAAINVQYRDVRHALTFLIQTWLFASPVVYPSSLVEGAIRWLYYANPIAGLLDTIRWSAIGGPAPGPEALVSLAVGAVIVLAGILYFERVERRFADVI
jgi:lipopolysaccharide transport system permease protein